jgi:hypothetical protein
LFIFVIGSVINILFLFFFRGCFPGPGFLAWILNCKMERRVLFYFYLFENSCFFFKELESLKLLVLGFYNKFYNYNKIIIYLLL